MYAATYVEIFNSNEYCILLDTFNCIFKPHVFSVDLPNIFINSYTDRQNVLE